jgi:hypothetical protein
VVLPAGRMCIQLSRNGCSIQSIEWFFRLIQVCRNGCVIHQRCESIERFFRLVACGSSAGMVVSFIKGVNRLRGSSGWSHVDPVVPEWMYHSVDWVVLPAGCVLIQVCRNGCVIHQRLPCNGRSCGLVSNAMWALRCWF